MIIDRININDEFLLSECTRCEREEYSDKLSSGIKWGYDKICNRCKGELAKYR